MPDGTVAASTRLRAGARAANKSVLRVRLFALLALGDLGAIIGGMAAASAFRTNEALSAQTVTILLVLLPTFGLMALNNRAYGVAVLKDWRLGARRAVSALLMTGFVVLGLGFALKVSSEYSRIAIGVGFAISALCILALRSVARPVVRRAMAGGFYEEIVLRDEVACRVRPGARVVDAVALGLEPLLDSHHMLDRIGRALAPADRVIVECPPHRRQAWADALKGLGVAVEVTLPEMDQLGLLALSRYDERVTALVARGPLGAREEFVKRSFDLAMVLAFAPGLLLVLALAMLAIKLDDGGPVFFTQRRIGRGNRLFDVYKLRSMAVASADATGARSTQRGDGRVTRIGHLLRRTSIDELPQLFNVLKGEMSIVGPRPHATGSTAADALFWEIDTRYWLRHAAKPGLTGLAQVRGFRGATATTADLTNRVQADLEYLSGWTLQRDLRILAATVKVLLHPNAF